MSMITSRNNGLVVAGLWLAASVAVAAPAAQTPVAAVPVTAPATTPMPEPAPGAAAMGPVHLGPASCASSVCHGRADANTGARVMQNEYRLWSREDAHARAYNSLLGPRSQAIAARLGLASAADAKVCLDCHADNVEPALRGEKFQLSDGVGCEACHGGAGDWIKSHAERGVAHADNLARGLVANENPEVRARLCLDCHLGNAEKFAGHDMMAAGHPRLGFELTAFTANQPAHYRVDDDYVQRKGPVSVAAIWAQGILAAVRAQVQLLQSPRLHGGGWFPELALFDCHACHHPMSERRFTELPMLRGLAPGAVRLNDGNLQMLVALAETLSPERGQRLLQAGNALHLGSQRGPAELHRQAAALATQLEALQSEVRVRPLARADLAKLRLTLLGRAEQGRFRDFVAAEQAFLAVETVSIELGDQDALRSRLDRWFKSVEDENHFNAARFAELAGHLLAKLRR